MKELELPENLIGRGTPLLYEPLLEQQPKPRNTHERTINRQEQLRQHLPQTQLHEPWCISFYVHSYHKRYLHSPNHNKSPSSCRLAWTSGMLLRNAVLSRHADYDSGMSAISKGAWVVEGVEARSKVIRLRSRRHPAKEREDQTERRFSTIPSTTKAIFFVGYL